jgi:hypothetical protein
MLQAFSITTIIHQRLDMRSRILEPTLKAEDTCMSVFTAHFMDPTSPLPSSFEKFIHIKASTPG